MEPVLVIGKEGIACLRKWVNPASSCQKSKRPRICSIVNAANCANSGIASSGGRESAELIDVDSG